MPKVLLGFLPPVWHDAALTAGYVLGRQIVVAARHSRMPLWRETIFAAMVRLSGSAVEYYRLPPDHVVELGSQAEI